MNYKTFERHMLRIKGLQNVGETFRKAGEKIDPDSYGFNPLGRSIDYMIDLLGDVTGGKDWLYWYIFETDWGKKPLKATIKGKQVKSKTLKDLYGILKA